MRYIGIIILLVLCLTLLLLAGCIVNTVIPETTSGNLGNQENTKEPVIVDTKESGTVNSQKWSGLTGFTTWYGHVSFANTWLANGFTEIRDIRNYLNTTEVNGSKAAVLAANAKGLKFIWGVGSSAITSSNWPTFRQAILDAATWAQANGVYEFQLGNEEEYHVDGTTMTIAQIITNLKSVATDVQKIFTNGNVSYSCWQDSIDDWITAGKGDIDILASNIYRGGYGVYNDNWKTDITKLVNAFGVDGTYISEFAPSYSSLEDYSKDEKVQAAGVTEMIEYIKASGMNRALFYSWHDYSSGLFGAVKNDGTYRLLWNQALFNSGSVKSTTVPTKTATISLPNTITLLAK
ncbi:MAG TPA: hypothetical protein VFC91_06580 [Atribacterota bacterium]|nr:hypothetical protein [Atribacterota bacterium]